MPGFLKITYGPMFSGKTSELMKVVETYLKTRDKGNILIINSKKDERPELNNINKLTSHSSLLTSLYDERLFTIKVENLNELNVPIRRNGKLIDIFNKDFEIVMIEESQFFEDLEDFVGILLKFGKHVHCFGLISDFKIEKFGYLYKLIPKADIVIQRYSICKRCLDEGKHEENAKAPFTAIKHHSDKQIEVGDDKYEAVCRRHHYIL